MMKLILSTLKKILFWSYERGSWQYDIMCVVILAFIILAPNRVFEQHDTTTPILMRSEQLGSIDPADLQQVELRLQQLTGKQVAVSRIEKTEDTLGEVYLIYQK